MDDVRRHRRVRWEEQARLVHIAPDPLDTGIQQWRMLLSPPRARFWIREIGKRADPRPDDILIVVSFRRLAIKVARSSFRVDGVSLIHLDTCINNAHRV